MKLTNQITAIFIFLVDMFPGGLRLLERRKIAHSSSKNHNLKCWASSKKRGSWFFELILLLILSMKLNYVEVFAHFKSDLRNLMACALAAWRY